MLGYKHVKRGRRNTRFTRRFKKAYKRIARRRHKRIGKRRNIYKSINKRTRYAQRSLRQNLRSLQAFTQQIATRTFYNTEDYNFINTSTNSSGVPYLFNGSLSYTPTLGDIFTLNDLNYVLLNWFYCNVMSISLTITCEYTQNFTRGGTVASTNTNMTQMGKSSHEPLIWFGYDINNYNTDMATLTVNRMSRMQNMKQIDIFGKNKTVLQWHAPKYAYGHNSSTTGWLSSTNSSTLFNNIDVSQSPGKWFVNWSDWINYAYAATSAAGAATFVLRINTAIVCNLNKSRAYQSY